MLCSTRAILASRSGSLCWTTSQRDLYVGSEVVVDQDVAQTCDLLPLDFRMPRAQLLGKLLDRLANDFKVADHGVDCLAILPKGLEVESRHVAPDLCRSVQDVFEIDPRIPRHRRPLGGCSREAVV